MTLQVDQREHPEMKKLLKDYIVRYAPEANKEISIDNIDKVDEADSIEIVQLKVADYADPENGFGVERKSADFIPEIRNGNLWGKLKELSQYPKAYLIVDKSLEEVFEDLWKSVKRSNKYKTHSERIKYFKGQKNAIMAAVASCAVRGFPPIFCAGKKEAAQLIVRLYFKAKDGKDRNAIQAVRPKATHKDRVMNVLVNYPFIAEKTAKALLEHYGCLENVNEGLKTLFKYPDKALMRELGLNKRNVEQAVAILLG